ncbi:HAD family hydrolase [Roseibium sp. SCP14]|uniref:HAD family hydrolase n=1 Tax=Roseibium sp. SCP14 TaxID=3141375 RepID=UPI00333CCDD7
MTSLTISAVVFDMDGVLIDSERLYCDSFLKAAEETGHAFQPADALALVGHAWKKNRMKILEKVGSEAEVDRLHAVWCRHFDDAKPRLQLKPGVKQLLHWARSNHLCTAVCTSSKPSTVYYYFSLHALADLFDVIVAAGDYSNSKPAPDPFLRVADLLDIPPAQCLVLEDSYAGILSATAAGMPVVMVPDLLPPTEMTRDQCLFIASDLNEVRARLLSLSPVTGFQDVR